MKNEQYSLLLLPCSKYRCLINMYNQVAGVYKQTYMLISLFLCMCMLHLCIEFVESIIIFVKKDLISFMYRN